MNCCLKCWLKKMHNLRGIELSFIWGKMRPAAQEAALQLVLRDCFKEVVGEGQHVRFWGKEEFRAINCWLRASLVAQLVKNPPEMQDTWVWSLGWEDPLEKGKAIWRRKQNSRTPSWVGLWTLGYMPSIYGNGIQTGKPDSPPNPHHHGRAPGLIPRLSIA